MRQNCIDAIEQQSAPLPSWGQWASEGVMMVKADTLQLWTLMRTWYIRHHTRRQMKNLPEHILDDIGISREDMIRAADKPFWRK